jgi:hypothetical protein
MERIIWSSPSRRIHEAGKPIPSHAHPVSLMSEVMSTLPDSVPAQIALRRGRVRQLFHFVMGAYLLAGPLLFAALEAQEPVPALQPGLVSPALTCSPAPCVLPNVQASGGGNSVSETPIASNPLNAAQLLTGGTDNNCSALLGFYATGDGGSTWNHNCLGTVVGFGGGGSPIVGYDRNGTAYAGGFNVRSRPLLVSVALASSTNNGGTWGTPVQAVTPLFSGGTLDKPWLQIDTSAASRHVNSLYISVTQFDSTGVTSQISVTHSTDGGLSWATVPVDVPQTYPLVDEFSGLAISRNGTCTSPGCAASRRVPAAPRRPAC